MSAQNPNPATNQQQQQQTPQQQQQQQPSPGSAPATRGQGRGRGRGRGGNTRNRDQAVRDLNPDGLPVGLGGAFLHMSSLQRKNVEVKINQGFTEIAAASYEKTIRAVQETRGFFDDQGQALDLEPLSLGLAGGLCNATAVKLLHATPDSEIPQISTFRSFREYQTYVPKSFVQITDLLGKTDFGDWVIRIKANPSLIQRLLLKSISYFKKIPDFMANYVYLTPDELARFNELDNVAKRDFDKIYFSDQGSVTAIKEHAEDWLKTHLNRNFQVTVRMPEGQEDRRIWLSYPQLPDVRDEAHLVEWLAKFEEGVHPDFEAIIATGILLLVNYRWLENPRMALEQLNPIFAGTALAQFTPIMILNASGLHHYQEYLSKENFIRIARSTYSFYGEYISVRLQNIFQMMTVGIQSTGSPGQLLYIPSDQRSLHREGNFDRYEPSSMLNHALSYMKVATPAPIIKASMIMLTDEVFFNPDYQAHFSQSLASIKSQFFSHDARTLTLQNLN